MVRLAETDGSVLAFRAEQARVAAHAAQAPAFNAAALIKGLAQRGIVLQLDKDCQIIASNARALTDLDRQLLARHRNEIANTLAISEKF